MSWRGGGRADRINKVSAMIYFLKYSKLTMFVISLRMVMLPRNVLIGKNRELILFMTLILIL